MSYSYIEDKLQLILPFVFLIVMLCLASQGSRFEPSMAYDDQREIFETNNTMEVALINKRDSKRMLGGRYPYPRAHRLDDGIQGDKSIKELMEGFRGIL
jgi:hypothetical protein